MRHFWSFSTTVSVWLVKILHFQNPVTLQVTWGQFGSIIRGDPDPMTPTTKNANFLWCGWDGAVATRVYRFCGYDENWKLYGCKEFTLKESVHDMFFWASISIVLTTTILPFVLRVVLQGESTFCQLLCHIINFWMKTLRFLKYRTFVPFLFWFMPLNM